MAGKLSASHQLALVDLRAGRHGHAGGHAANSELSVAEGRDDEPGEEFAVGIMCYSFLYTTPSFITNFTCPMTCISLIGSPSTSMISASLPASMLPTLSLTPMSSAAFPVAHFSASIAGMPASVMYTTSIQFLPWAYTP